MLWAFYQQWMDDLFACHPCSTWVYWIWSVLNFSSEFYIFIHIKHPLLSIWRTPFSIFWSSLVVMKAIRFLFGQVSFPPSFLGHGFAIDLPPPLDTSSLLPSPLPMVFPPHSKASLCFSLCLIISAVPSTSSVSPECAHQCFNFIVLWTCDTPRGLTSLDTWCSVGGSVMEDCRTRRVWSFGGGSGSLGEGGTFRNQPHLSTLWRQSQGAHATQAPGAFTSPHDQLFPWTWSPNKSLY